MLTALKAGTRYSIIRGVLQASLMEGAFVVPALPPYIIEPIWEQFRALLPQREVDHPLGCHRPRISERVVFEKLVQVLVFGCAYRRIADEGCSATTLRERRRRMDRARGDGGAAGKSTRGLRPAHRS